MKRERKMSRESGTLVRGPYTVRDSRSELVVPVEERHHKGIGVVVWFMDHDGDWKITSAAGPSEHSR